MKSVGLILILGLLSAKVALAADFKCMNQAVLSVVTQHYRAFDVSTSSCGIKNLAMSEDTESFLVCVKDEMNFLEYSIVLTKNQCQISSILISNDEAAPYFEQTKNILSEFNCAIEYGNKNTGVYCQ